MRSARELFEVEIDFARKMMIERGRLAPQFSLFCEGGLLVPIIAPELGESNAKAAIYDLVRLMAIAHDAWAIISTMEAWFAHPKPGLEDIEPGDREDKDECVVLSMVSRGNKPMFWLGVIKRDDGGKVIALDPLADEETMRTASPQGPSFDLLPEGRPNAKQRAVALKLLDVLGQAGGLKKVPIDQRH